MLRVTDRLHQGLILEVIDWDKICDYIMHKSNVLYCSGRKPVEHKFYALFQLELQSYELRSQ